MKRLGRLALSITWLLVVLAPGGAASGATPVPAGDDDRLWWSPVSAIQGLSRSEVATWAGALAASAALGFALDSQAKSAFEDRGRLGGLSLGTNELIGTGLPGLGLGAALWLNGLSPTTAPVLADRNRRTGEAILKSILWTFISTSALKIATARERPDGSDRRSFPSGHTSTVMALVFPVAGRFGWVAGGVTAGLGVVTGLARVETGRHHFSDTVAGAGLGLFWGWLFARYHFVDLERLELISFSIGELSESAHGVRGVQATLSF
jgi:membrane-associated phospholipid phosphatase